MATYIIPHPHVEPAISYISQVDDPVYAPTGEVNQRKCRCSNCRRQLLPGQGRQWDYSDQAKCLIPRRSPSYFCPDCHSYQYQLLQIQPEIQLALAQIKAWCADYVTLHMGYTTYSRISDLIGKCGLQGAEVAGRIADYLPSLQDTSYTTVLSLAEAIAAQICGGPVDGGA